MAFKKSEKDLYIHISEKEYLTLLEDIMILKALKIAGVEKMPIYQSVQSIIQDGRVEIHQYPIKKRHK